MKQGRTIEQLAAELDRRAKSKVDAIVTTPALTIATGDDGESSIAVDGAPQFDGGLGVKALAHRQIGERLGIPAKYYDRLRGAHPELLDQNVNYLWRAEPERRMIRTLDGQVRAYLSDRYRRIDDEDIAEVVIPIIAEQMRDLGARVESCELTDTRMYLKVVLPAYEVEIPEVGDTLWYGYVVSNSEVGMGAFSVAPFTYTLACQNGMVVTEWGTRKYHVGARIEAETDEARILYRDETVRQDDRALMMKIEDVIRGATSDLVFSAIVGRLRELAGLEITGDPVRSVEILQRKAGLSDDERGGVLRYLIQGGNLSAYGLVNAVTRLSQDIDDYDRATELETIGGTIAGWDDRTLAEVLVAA